MENPEERAKRVVKEYGESVNEYLEELNVQRINGILAENDFALAVIMRLHGAFLEHLDRVLPPHVVMMISGTLASLIKTTAEVAIDVYTGTSPLVDRSLLDCLPEDDQNYLADILKGLENDEN